MGEMTTESSGLSVKPLGALFSLKGTFNAIATTAAPPVNNPSRPTSNYAILPRVLPPKLLILRASHRPSALHLMAEYSPKFFAPQALHEASNYR